MKQEERDRMESLELASVSLPGALEKRKSSKSQNRLESQADAEAVDWFKKAAEQGHRESQFNLGMAYMKGTGVLQSFSEAAEWFRLAAIQGHPEAQYNYAN